MTSPASNLAHNIVAMPLPGASAGEHSSAPTEAQMAKYSEIAVVPEDQLNTYIAPGAVVKGTLEVAEGARIAGTVTGDLICSNGSAVIEHTGVVSGSVQASARVIVMGGAVGTPAQDPKARPATELVCPGDLIIVGPSIVHVEAYVGTMSAYDGGMIDGGAHPYAKYSA